MAVVTGSIVLCCHYIRNIGKNSKISFAYKKKNTCCFIVTFTVKVMFEIKQVIKVLERETLER